MEVERVSERRKQGIGCERSRGLEAELQESENDNVSRLGCERSRGLEAELQESESENDNASGL